MAGTAYIKLNTPSKSTQVVAIDKKLFGGSILDCKAALGKPILDGILLDDSGTVQMLADRIKAHRETRLGQSMVEMYGEVVHDLSGIVTVLTPDDYRKMPGKAATFDDLKVRSRLPRAVIEYEAEVTVNEIMRRVISKTLFTGTISIEVPAIPDIQHLIACSLARALSHDVWFTKFQGTVATGERDPNDEYLGQPGDATGITVIGGNVRYAATSLVLMPPISYDEMTLMSDEAMKTIMQIASARQTIVNLLQAMPNIDLRKINQVADKVAGLLKMAFKRDAIEATNFAIELANQNETEALFSRFIEPQVPEIIQYAKEMAAEIARQTRTTSETEVTGPESKDSSGSPPGMAMA